MKELEAIKARAEVNAILGKTASQDEAKDTLKLIAALEAAGKLAERWHEEHASNPSEATVIRDWAACDIEEDIKEALR